MNDPAKDDAATVSPAPAQSPGPGAPYLIFLRGGPIFDDNSIRFHARALSPRFEGEFWYSGLEETDRWVGNFRLRRLVLKNFSAKGQLTEFRARIVADFLARRSQLAGRKIVVITYDPLTLGMIGAYLAWRLKARLIIELSGAYGNAHNLADMSKGWRRRLTQARNIDIGQGVMLRADGVRCLFHGQDTAFVKVPPWVQSHLFFDGIDTSRFAGDPARDEKTVLFIGHPFYVKGTDVLLEAWRRIEGRYPDWRLLLIGFELDWHIDAARQRDLRVEVMKPMPNAEVAEYMKRCGIFVLASRSEGLPRVLIEAAAAGRARISTRTCGIPRTIENEVDGLLVEVGDSAGLAAALVRLIEDPALRQRFGEAAQTRNEQRFSADRYRHDLSTCLDAVLGNAAPGMEINAAHGGR